MHPLVSPVARLVSAAAIAAVSATAQEEAQVATLSVQEAYALALEHNPRLQVFAWDIRAADAQILQASLRPNPEMTVEAEDLRIMDGAAEVAESAQVGLGGFEFEREKTEGSPAGIGESEITLSLSQRFELGGKRARRVEAAEAGKRVAERDYEIARLNVLTDVARAYVEVLAAQRRAEVREQLAALAQQVADTIGARAEAGKVSPIEADRARVLFSTTRIEVGRALRALTAAKATLSALWGNPHAEFGRVDGTLETLTDIPPLDTLQGLVADNPDLRAWMTEIAHREAIVQFEQSRRIPDLTVGLGIRSTGVRGTNSERYGLGPDGPWYAQNDTDFDRRREPSIVLGATIPLPIFDRNQGNIEEARVLLDKAYDERRLTQLDVESMLARWYHQARAAREEIEQLQDETIPTADDVFGKTKLSYDAGKFGYLEVLDAQRSLFDLRVRLLEAFAEYHLARVEIERLIGQPMATAPNSTVPSLPAQSDMPTEPTTNADESPREEQNHGKTTD